MPFKLFAFAASNSYKSINQKLVNHAIDILRGEMGQELVLETFDLEAQEPPLFSIRREEENGPSAIAQDFLDHIGRADALLVSFAEHNGSYCAAYKNLYDWASRVARKPYQDKPMLAMATSPGGRGGSNVLGQFQSTAPFQGASLASTFSLPKFNENFDAEAGLITDPEHAASLRTALKQLVETASA